LFEEFELELIAACCDGVRAGLRVEGPSQARLEPKKNADGSMDVAYYPTEPGEYAVHVLCNQEDIPKSPYMADIKPAPAPGFDPTKVIVLGPDFQNFLTGPILRNFSGCTISKVHV